MKLKQRRTRNGFTLVDILMIVFILAVLAVVLWPKMARPNMHSARIRCTNNLKQLGLGYRQWALDNGDKNPMRVSITNGGTMELVESGVVYPHYQVMSNELNTPKILRCPDDKSRTAATSFTTNFSDKNLSYFVGVDAVDTAPQMFISGDDNFTVNGKKPKPGLLLLATNSPVAWTKDRHVNQGNIGLADGSVQQFSTGKLMEGFCNTGLATNRLALP
jgi:prepilin-type processing-associated H-X9-DG protein